MSPNPDSGSTVAPPQAQALAQCDALNPDNLSPNFQEFLNLLDSDDKGKGKKGGGGDSAATTPETTPEPSPDEIGGHPLPPRPSLANDSEGEVMPNYDVQQYNYLYRHGPAMADFSTAINSTTVTGKRCYRLNLERPFDIHCEQSPLEYGDYMAPWTKEVQPPTVGPTEYCPPRHLGGEEAVWRELMRWSHGSTTAQNKKMADSADNEKEGSDDETAKTVASYHASGIGGSGWRKLKPQEYLKVKQLGEYNQDGELAFQTYDLSHVTLNKASLAAHNAASARGNVPLAREDKSVRTIVSVDSDTSEQERRNRKTAEETADATARLFRRSEVSLRETREKEEAEEKRKMQQEAEEKRLEKERKKLEGGKKKGGSMKLGKSFKKIVRKMSSSSADKPTRSRAGGTASRKNPSPVMRCSVQASQIDKARDMVDGYADGEGGLIIAPGDGQVAGKAEEVAPKKLNISIFVVGEYDILNDLVNNGAKRLSDSKESSDLDLLRQNDPCPPPDRWVRSTGWGKCNPSSNYARTPPEDFDWEKYDDKLWLKTDDPKKAEAIPGGTGLYERRTYAKTPAVREEDAEDTLSQSQRVRRSRRRAGAAKAATAKQAAPEEEDTLSQSQRVRRSRRRLPTKN